MTTKVALATMKVAQIPKGGADFEIVEREIPKPDVGHVRIKVQACGVCHSDVFTKEGAWPGIQYPRVPGHEVAGIIDELGAGVSVSHARRIVQKDLDIAEYADPGVLGTMERKVRLSVCYDGVPLSLEQKRRTR
jgi:hypothetical protein